MRRLLVVNALIFAVLASAAALAYYGYSYTADLSSRERALAEDTMHELAAEKVIGIESQIIDVDQKLFATIDPDNLGDLAATVRAQQAPIASVFVLGPDLRSLPSGYVSSRPGDEALDFRGLFEDQIVPLLPLTKQPEDRRGHVHLVLHGRPYLFGFTRRAAHGQWYYVVVETDLLHLVASVFPQFFGLVSPRLYQVVDEAGELVASSLRGTGNRINDVEVMEYVAFLKTRDGAILEVSVIAGAVPQYPVAILLSTTAMVWGYSFLR